MEKDFKVAENIYRVTAPYKGIFTSVFAIKTPKGVLVFDVASFDEDAENYILPFFKEIDVTEDMIKYVFISHGHSDHAGGINGFEKAFPKTKFITTSPSFKYEYPHLDISLVNDGDYVLDVLKVVTIAGHTEESAAIFDTRTKTLLSGDCLQSYGIFGCGTWGVNVPFPAEHIKAVENVRKMDIDSIITAHDFCPYGFRYDGKAEIERALDSCISPIYEIANLIKENPTLSDEEITKLYNSPKRPTLGERIVTAIRKTL